MGFILPDIHKRTVVNLFVRLCQLVGAIAVCVYYGRILGDAAKHNVPADSKWVLATAVGAISGLTAMVYMFWSVFLEFRAIAILFAWDTIMVLLWIVVSGIFGKMYIGENPEMDEGIERMKVAVGFDLANMVLWMATASYCGYVVFIADRKLLFEGRMKFNGGGDEGGEKTRNRR